MSTRAIVAEGEQGGPAVGLPGAGGVPGAGGRLRARDPPAPRTGVGEHASARARHGWAVVLYEAFYSGAIGGSAVALLFLVVDVVQGRPFFTPSLMGHMLFRGAPPESVTGADLDMVAYYSVVHMALFALVGLVVASTVHVVKASARRPWFVLAVLFGVLDGGFLLLSALVMPAVVGWLGTLWITLANLLAAALMAAFLAWSHARMG